MKIYYIESYRGWFVVKCQNKKQAQLEAIHEFGRGHIKNIRQATPEEIEYFTSIKGKQALEPCIE